MVYRSCSRLCHSRDTLQDDTFHVILRPDTCPGMSIATHHNYIIVLNPIVWHSWTVDELRTPSNSARKGTPHIAYYNATLHRALCSLFQPDTDGTRVSKCGQLSQQTRRLDLMLFQCWSSAVGGGPILKQHWVKSSRLLGSTQVSAPTPPPP